MEAQTKQTKYESIKKSAGKYAGLALLASALALPSYARAESFPVDAETRSSVVYSQEQVYSNALANARSAFNKGIADRTFTIDEQEQVHKYFREAKVIHENLPAEYKDLDALINKNLNNWDVGIPSLQEKLKEQDLEVEVEGTCVPELALFAAPLFAFLGTIAFLNWRDRNY